MQVYRVKSSSGSQSRNIVAELSVAENKFKYFKHWKTQIYIRTKIIAARLWQSEKRSLLNLNVNQMLIYIYTSFCRTGFKTFKRLAVECRLTVRILAVECRLILKILFSEDTKSGTSWKLRKIKTSQILTVFSKTHQQTNRQPRSTSLLSYIYIYIYL